VHEECETRIKRVPNNTMKNIQKNKIKIIKRKRKKKGEVDNEKVGR
jgi:hypothetical protein